MAALTATTWLACGEQQADPAGLDAATAASADAATPLDAAQAGEDAAQAGPDASQPGPDAAAPFDASVPVAAPRLWKSVTMPNARANHTMTVLKSGNVVLAGGEVFGGSGRVAIKAVDYFWPGSGTFSRGPDLPEARANHSATRLADGRVLLAGGGVSSLNGQPVGGPNTLASAVLFDSSKGTFAPTGALTLARSHHAAVPLDDGRVLVVGGGLAAIDPQSKVGVATGTAEIYDPATGTWRAAAPMQFPRYLPRATVLADGRVLVTGGGDHTFATIAEPEIYDPATDTWKTAALPAGHGRIYHGAVRLASGHVLVACGMNWTPVNGWRSDAEFYDPAKDEWFPAGDTAATRSAPVVVGLGEKVVVAGGQHRVGNNFPFVEDTHVYDEVGGDWAQGPALNTPRSLGSAVLLLSGDVLACGGFSEAGVEASCELSSR